MSAENMMTARLPYPIAALRAAVVAGLSLLAFVSAAHGSETAPPKPSPLWVTGYYAAWKQDILKPEEIDFGTVTHVVHFSLVPTPNGGLDAKNNGLTETQSQAVVAAAHRAGRKALICIGGANSGAAFRAAFTLPAQRTVFVRNIVDWTVKRGYDGVDIDMEPVEDSDAPPFAAFIRELRAALRAKNPALLLTAAVQISAATPFLPLTDSFDQINVMTYDLAGPWEGWETWHNTALYSGGKTFQSVPGKLLPSVDSELQKWFKKGFPRTKTGIGLAFYGVAWQGATGPNQPIAGVSIKQVNYSEIAADYLRPERFHWDTGAHAPYLSITTDPVSGKSVFLSYENERSCAEKIRYARDQKIGGVIIWELGGGHRGTLPKGKRDPLLQAVHQALLAPLP